jgi:hypothetical protein
VFRREAVEFIHEQLVDARNSGVTRFRLRSYAILMPASGRLAYPQYLNKSSSAVGLLAQAALVCSALLLFSNLPFTSARGGNAWLSSLPLALVGIAFAVLQIRLRPALRTLLKRLLLAAAFIFWAIDQILPPGRLATLIGDAVISAYVLDLFWMIQEQSQAGSGKNGGDRIA